jgi:thioester reductase-like protein
MSGGIVNFYKDKTIFITGGSGFMGKVLLEKLLYSCSDLKQIMILMRPKRGKSGAERVEEFKKVPVIFGDLILNEYDQQIVKFIFQGLSTYLRRKT